MGEISTYIYPKNIFQNINIRGSGNPKRTLCAISNLKNVFRIYVGGYFTHINAFRWLLPRGSKIINTLKKLWIDFEIGEYAVLTEEDKAALARLTGLRSLNIQNLESNNNTLGDILSQNDLFASKLVELGLHDCSINDYVIEAISNMKICNLELRSSRALSEIKWRTHLGRDKELNKTLKTLSISDYLDRMDIPNLVKDITMLENLEELRIHGKNNIGVYLSPFLDEECNFRETLKTLIISSRGYAGLSKKHLRALSACKRLRNMGVHDLKAKNSFATKLEMVIDEPEVYDKILSIIKWN
jgi:hypothetical protein